MKSKKVFLDINIIVDFIEPARARNKSAIQLFELLISNSYQIYISEDMLSTIFYIVKDRGLDCIEDIQDILKIKDEELFK